MNKEEQAFHYLVDEYMQIPKEWEDYKIIKNAIQENKELHNKIDKAIEYLINPPKKIWEGHSIDEVVRILKDSDVDE